VFQEVNHRQEAAANAEPFRASLRFVPTSGKSSLVGRTTLSPLSSQRSFSVQGEGGGEGNCVWDCGHGGDREREKRGCRASEREKHSDEREGTLIVWF
jgi:hypothetical protein